MSNPSSFGLLLRKRRQEAGFTLRGLARVIGTSHALLSQVEHGRLPSLGRDIVRNIAAALAVSPDELEKAAAVSRGAFSLPAGPTPLHVEVGAALASAWPKLSARDLRALRAALPASAPRAER